MNKYCLVVLLLNLHLVKQSSSLLQRNLKGNLFHKVNNDVQNTVNKIFELLHLNKNFTSLRKHRLLLSMHASMKSMAENNYPHYKDMRRASKVSLKTKMKNVLFNLKKLINILVQERLTPGNTTIHNYHHNKTGINLQLTSLEFPENQAESFAFLKEYLNSLDDSHKIDSPLLKIKNEFEKNSRKVKERRKLKAWKTTVAETEQNNHTNSRRVFQGKSANIRKFPFLASIHMLGEFVCAGSIINKLMIITAATCLQRVFYEGNKEIITVRVGSDYTNKSGILCNVSQIFFHPYYNPETLNNNLAILKIQEELKFKQKAKMRRVDYQRLEGKLHSSVKNILFVGWEDLNYEYTGDKEQLSYSHLDVYNLQTCIETYTSKYVNEKNICAGSTIAVGACQHDVGAPGIVGNVLVGVVSFGPPVCGTVDAPTVFTNLGYYIDWIDNVIKETPFGYTTTPLLVEQPKLRADDSDDSIPITQLESTTISTMSKQKTTPVALTTTSQYPKAIKVLTYLLNKLLTSDQNSDEDNQQSASRSNVDRGVIKNPSFLSFSQRPSNNDDQHSSNNLKNMLINNVGGLFGLNTVVNFTEVAVPDEQTEQKFEYRNVDVTPYRSNVKMEKTFQYAPVSASSNVMESSFQNETTHSESEIRKLLKNSAAKDENTMRPGIIFESTNDAITHAVIFEDTNGPNDFNGSEKSEELEPNISDNYETTNNDGLSIEMPSEHFDSSSKSYKFRTTRDYTGPVYKKDYDFDFIIGKKNN